MSSAQPNVLFILADQHRYDCTGLAGLRPISTPNIDRIGREGAWFTRAFSPTPVCAPARQSLLSGLRAESLGALWNYNFIETKTLTPDTPNFPLALSSAGYQSAFFGHWDASPKYGPKEFGYGEVQERDDYNAYIKSKYPGLAYQSKWFGEKSPLPLEDSRTHFFAARACEKIRQFSGEGKPWHIIVDATDPHLPCRPSEPFASMYAPEDIPRWEGFGDSFDGKPYIQKQQLYSWGLEDMAWEDWAPTVAAYYGMISQLDDAVGMMLRALDEAGCANETLVVYTSDHGDMCGSHGMIDKHYVLYDDVLRVPLALRLPDAIPTRTIADDFVHNCLDLAPTIYELCGLGVPENMHGESLVPLARGVAGLRRPYAVSAANGQQFGSYTQRCIRTERYKYVWNLTDIDELYDLVTDPGEKINLVRAPESERILAELRPLLYAELKRCSDPFAVSGWLDRQLLEGKKL